MAVMDSHVAIDKCNVVDEGCLCKFFTKINKTAVITLIDI
jgi:hypothetical protein